MNYRIFANAKQNNMKKNIFLIISCLFLFCSVQAVAQNNESDLDESVRLPIRRLHPERELEKAKKQLQKELDEKKQKQAKATTDSKKQDESQFGESTGALSPDKQLMMELLNKDYSIKQYDFGAEDPKPLTWKDDPINQETDALMATMHKSLNGNQYNLYSSDISFGNNSNALFFYLDCNGNRAEELRMRVQYVADDPLSYDKIEFVIDGFLYQYVPRKKTHGRIGAKLYWEVSDDALNSDDKDLVYALSHCSWARAKLIGKDGINHVKVLTTEQLKSFYNALELFRALGGELR